MSRAPSTATEVDAALWAVCDLAVSAEIIKSGTDDVKAGTRRFFEAMARYGAAQLSGENDAAGVWRRAAVEAKAEAEAAIGRHLDGREVAPKGWTASVLRTFVLAHWDQVAQWPGGSVTAEEASVLPVVSLSELAVPPDEARWLVKDLWGRSAVGIIGGHPKSRKTFLALEMAVAVASATPCLGRFDTKQGRVLAFIGEGQESEVKERVSMLAAARKVDVGDLPIHLIRAPRLFLDSQEDTDRLDRTVARAKPDLLILDPFVRLHRGDENDSGHVSRVLGYLRGLQREFNLAIVLVHHFKKSASFDGLGLRGSGDLHAWGDSNLYLHRVRDSLQLRAEHRSAPQAGPWNIEVHDEPFALLATDHVPEDNDEIGAASLRDRVLAYLAQSGEPQSRADLRAAMRVRNDRLGDVLRELVTKGRVVQDDEHRYVLADASGL